MPTDLSAVAPALLSVRGKDGQNGGVFGVARLHHTRTASYLVGRDQLFGLEVENCGLQLASIVSSFQASCD